MKFNHEFVRSWIRWVSLSLFIGAAAYKFKKIIDAGKVDIENDEDDYEDPTSEEPAVSGSTPETEDYEE